MLAPSQVSAAASTTAAETHADREKSSVRPPEPAIGPVQLVSAVRHPNSSVGSASLAAIVSSTSLPSSAAASLSLCPNLAVTNSRSGLVSVDKEKGGNGPRASLGTT